MKIDLRAKDSLEKNGLRIIREGFAAAKFGVCLDGGGLQAADGTAVMRLAAGEDEGSEAPNPEEFLVKPFRILSAVVTPGRFFDFTKEGVLKAAVPLFEKLTVYANHNADVNQWKGYTAGPVWDAKNTPNGINANMVIDRTVDANLARGLEIGALRSASVTIWFEYHRSHPDLNYYWDYVGKEVDGQIVRFIVTRITRAAEVSVVWEGEDPFAKALAALAGGEDNSQTMFEEEGEEAMKLNNDALARQLGLTAGEDVSAEALEAAVAKTIGALETKAAQLEPDVRVGKKHLEDTRNRAATLYKTAKGEKFRQDYVDQVILKSDLDTALAMAEEFGDQVEEAAPLCCPKCGEKLSRRASLAAGEDRPGRDDRRADDFKLA